MVGQQTLDRLVKAYHEEKPEELSRELRDQLVEEPDGYHYITLGQIPDLDHVMDVWSAEDRLAEHYDIDPEEVDLDGNPSTLAESVVRKIIADYINGSFEDPDASDACAAQELTSSSGETACVVLCSGGYAFAWTYYENIFWYDSLRHFVDSLKVGSLLIDDWEQKREQILDAIVPRIMRREKIDDLDFWEIY